MKYTEKEIPQAAKRALAEAAQRRKDSDSRAKNAAREINGRDGPDPARFGDWEKNGLAVDF
jgi:hypothetical protein